MSALWPSLDFKSLFVFKVIWTTQATPVWGMGRGLHTLTTLPQPILGGFLHTLTIPSIASIGGLPAHADHAFVCFTPVHKPPTPTMMLLPHPTELQTHLILFQSSLYSKVQSREALVPGQLLSLSVSSMAHWVFCEMLLIYHGLVFPHDVPRVADFG